MKLASKNVPYGALSYESIEPVTKMIAKLFQDSPYLAFLPKFSEGDTILKRTFEGIPGVKIKDKKRVILKTETNSYKQAVLKLDKAYNNPSKKNLEPFAIESPFLEKFLQIIKKFNSKNAYVNLLGPFTVSQMLINAAAEQMLVDKSYRKLFIQSICVKALWIIEKIKEINPETVPVIVLEEPLFSQFGVIKRDNDEVTPELVTNLFSRVIEKIKSAGALVAVQSMEKCDWKIPISAGVDIISFDAYNNPNNISIIPDVIIDFIGRGGKMLKEIGSRARVDIDRFLETKVFLEVWVKVREDWRDNESELRKLHYME
jgi:hypothetical protein